MTNPLPTPRSPPKIPASKAHERNRIRRCKGQCVPWSCLQTIIFFPWYNPIAWYRETPTVTGIYKTKNLITKVVSNCQFDVVGIKLSHIIWHSKRKCTKLPVKK